MKSFYRILPIGLAAYALSVPLIQAEMRDWNSSDGRKLKAEYVRPKGEVGITVRTEAGKLTDIPLDKLSDEDRKIAAGLNENSRKEATAVEEKNKKEKFLKGPLTYKLSAGSEKWPEDRRKRIVDAMDAAVAFLNEHGDFKKSVTANNSPRTPTADANWDGWINWGGSISRRVALHEIAHTLGIGTHANWSANIEDKKWTGKHALKQLREFDGPDAVLHADGMHFWPYGLNFDQESSPTNDLRFIKMVEAMRKDMDIR